MQAQRHAENYCSGTVKYCNFSQTTVLNIHNCENIISFSDNNKVENKKKERRKEDKKKKDDLETSDEECPDSQGKPK